ncbi:hypothetical protein DMB66_34815 [Actinoplanes sp. ATCC 53533]|uniref:hypothetical protein n=1 Tax=Actinoplanes sp. ATCC 53533 TaxID=1288362 RepID=UPI000F78BE10|nr:hypothetical protein [Actinoplanes sp. ATCC 53533]RSM55878.1 hypothetical protein DMB66_34815 [Actinoplanes sp. ATCC 53533]
MALEWVVSDGRPTHPDELVPLIEASFERYFQRGVSRQPDEASPGSAEHEFSTVLELSVDGEAARVHLDQMSYDEATGTCSGYVEADRTGLSVAAGIVAAVCWNAQSGGRLSGTGLGGEQLSADESLAFLDGLFQDAGSAEERVGVITRRLGFE